MDRYIGITGFKTIDEVITCKVNSMGQKPIVMYGVLTSAKTIAYPEKEGTRRPSLENLGALLWKIPIGSLPTIHHCTYNRKFSQELDTILSYDRIYDLGLVKAVQINQRLPEVSEIEKIKKKYSDIKIILQLEPDDIADPKATGRLVNDYDGLVDYFIIDPSRGIGKGLDVNDTMTMLDNIKINAMPVIAGGLCASNVGYLVKFFRKEYGDNFCIDVEGRIRDADDKLNIKKMTEYMGEAYRAYK
jgi:phosphoribosylanthranilate isomerase